MSDNQDKIPQLLEKLELLLKTQENFNLGVNELRSDILALQNTKPNLEEDNITKESQLTESNIQKSSAVANSAEHISESNLTKKKEPVSHVEPLRKITPITKHMACR
ncbi:MAG: hypothetical protein ACI9SG_000825, partial [Maribacter sp.]